MVFVFGGQSLPLITPRTLILDLIVTIKRQEPNVSAIKAIPLGRGLYICTVDGLQCTTSSRYYFLTLISKAMDWLLIFYILNSFQICAAI